MPAPSAHPDPSTTTASTPSAQPSASNSSVPSNPDPSTLPPAALALATRLFDAARTGQMDIFRQALPAGLPANMTNDKGDSLLMLSAYHSHPALVRLLLAHGADPNVLNDRGQSPLAGAVFKYAGARAGSNNEAEVIEALLEGGADPDWGTPSAMDSVGMFKVGDVWRGRFEEARGRGSMAGRERGGGNEGGNWGRGGMTETRDWGGMKEDGISRRR